MNTADLRQHLKKSNLIPNKACQPPKPRSDETVTSFGLDALTTNFSSPSSPSSTRINAKFTAAVRTIPPLGICAQVKAQRGWYNKGSHEGPLLLGPRESI